jgi:hypothetical protein
VNCLPYEFHSEHAPTTHFCWSSTGQEQRQVFIVIKKTLHSVHRDQRESSTSSSPASGIVPAGGPLPSPPMRGTGMWAHQCGFVGGACGGGSSRPFPCGGSCGARLNTLLHILAPSRAEPPQPIAAPRAALAEAETPQYFFQPLHFACREVLRPFLGS